MLRRTLALTLVGVGLALTALGSGEVPTPAADPRPPGRPPVTVTVFAAASLTEAFNVIGRRFEADHPGVTVVFHYAGSQQLAAQINQGAPADVFASANAAQMQAAAAAGRLAAPQVFALNRLVVIFPADNPGRLLELKDLAKPGLRIVLAAESVPAGQYALDFLDKAGQAEAWGPAFAAAVRRNVVSYENNVNQVFAKVALGEADAGLVYTTDVQGANAQKVGRLEIPDALNVIAQYPIAALIDSAHADEARGFVGFVLSPEGQSLLSQSGFLPAASARP